MKTKCLIVLSFGMGKGIGNYGSSNVALAKIAAENGLPIIAQWEIASLLKQLVRTPIESIEQEDGSYLDTYSVLVKAKKAMEIFGYTEAILVGHQDHLPRIKLMAKAIGLKTSIQKINAFIPYDKESTQWWTRNRFFFLSREILVYIVSIFKGEI